MVQSAGDDGDLRERVRALEAVIEEMAKERRDLEIALTVLVLRGGGSVRIPRAQLEEAGGVTIATLMTPEGFSIAVERQSVSKLPGASKAGRA